MNRYADGYTAVLKNVVLAKAPYSERDVAYGDIYDDRCGRFEDGKPVITSEVMAIAHVEDVCYIITRNSIYKVEGQLEDRR